MPIIHFICNNFTSIQLGSQAHMATQVLSYSVLTAKLVAHETCRAFRYQRKFKPLIVERRELNYPAVRLDINGVPKTKCGHTIH